MSSKENALRSMALAVLVLEVRRGHLKWKVTELGKRAGYSRGLVYQYLGATKPEILRNALEVFLRAFYSLDNDNFGETLGAKVASTRRFLVDHPEPILFYQKWRAGEGSWIREALVDAERDFRKRIRARFPGITPSQLILFHALLHGLVTAPFLDAKTAAEGGRELGRLLGTLKA